MPTNKTDTIPSAPAAAQPSVDSTEPEAVTPQGPERRNRALIIAGITVGAVVVAGALFGGGVALGSTLPGGAGHSHIGQGQRDADGSRTSPDGKDRQGKGGPGHRGQRDMNDEGGPDQGSSDEGSSDQGK